MISDELMDRVKPFHLLCNPRAISETYRSLEIGPTAIRGCASYGVLEAAIDLPLELPCVVDAAKFLAVVASLPEHADVAITMQGTALAWRCGSGRGKLDTIAGITIPPHYEKLLAGQPRSVSTGLKHALDLGSLSCGSNALTSMGLFGVVINGAESPVKVYSCDNTTISSCVVDGDMPEDLPNSVTLSPAACKLLQAILSPRLGAVIFEGNQILYADGVYKLRLEQLDPLPHDIAAYEKPYQTAEITVPIPKERVAAFVKRATAMAESKRATHVDVAVTEGRLNLAFVAGGSDTDEYFLVDGLDPALNLGPVKLDAAKLGRALQHADKLVLDHFERSVVVLRGDGDRFMYSITGVEHRK